MNLKEAFRFQNKLQLLMDEAQAILNNPGNVTRTEKTYLRKKVMPEAENETVVVEQDCLYADRITEVAGFLLWILAQREALSAAIRRTKNTLPIDMDGEVCLNTLRQSAAQRPAGRTFGYCLTRLWPIWGAVPIRLRDGKTVKIKVSSRLRPAARFLRYAVLVPTLPGSPPWGPPAAR